MRAGGARSRCELHGYICVYEQNLERSEIVEARQLEWSECESIRQNQEMLVRMGLSPRLTSRHHRIPTPPACTPSSQLCGEETESAARVSSVPTAQTFTANVRARMNGQGVGPQAFKGGGVRVGDANCEGHTCRRVVALEQPMGPRVREHAITEQRSKLSRKTLRHQVPRAPFPTSPHTHTQTIRRLGNCVLQSDFTCPKEKSFATQKLNTQ